MASHKSAIKQNRKDVHRRAANRAHRSSLRTAVKSARSAIASGSVKQETGRTAVASALSALDRKAAKGIIHPNAASRVKSRLMKQAVKASAAR